MSGRARYGRGPLGTLGYFVSMPVLRALARLPFPVLHGFSDVASWLAYRVFRFRRRVVLDNLHRCFPDASPAEIDRIARGSYRHAFDVTVEVVKQLRLTPDEIAARVDIDLPCARELAVEGRSCIFVLGHMGNWEWAIPAAVRNILPEGAVLHVVYHPLKHPGFDRLFREVRESAGAVVSPMAGALRRTVQLRDTLTGTVLVADQRPRSRGAQRTTFFGRETGFFRGPERMARGLDQPVLFCTIERTGRGRYRIRDEWLCREPSETAEGEITDRYARRLEEAIRKDPENWLWSHRRWRDRRAERGLPPIEESDAATGA